MLSLDTIDAGQAFDWGRTCAEYANYRPGPSHSFYAMVANVGAGEPELRLLDLGTGLLAQEFARRGARVCGSNFSPQQIEVARALDGELAALLERIAGEQFTILHRIDAHLFEINNEPRLAKPVPHRRCNRIMPARGRMP
ncbi:MAG: hypothetical protein O6934_14540 [SAR324 cluster bacterium]|nr:hypothetical protein [SAR324 cluster bacterium]